jgi:ligand-binding sensor domain-containing protein
LYFETPRGISKYDGREFTTLKAIRMPNNVWKLEPNDLWFGNSGKDLYRFDGRSLYELTLPRKDLKTAFGKESEGSSAYTVYGINKDKDGNVWFGTESAGAFRYDGRAFLWFGEKELSALPDGRVPGVRAILQDREGYFWLSNVSSKYKINPDLPKGYVKLKAADLENEMAKDELLYFNSGIADDKGNLWMTTYGGGVWKYDGKKLSSLEVKSSTENVLLVFIYQDKSGRIWLGTDNDGVYKQSGESFVKFDPNL